VAQASDRQPSIRGLGAPHCVAESAAPHDFLGSGPTGQDGVSRSFVAGDAATAAATVARIIDAGAVGINVEDGRDAPDLLCAKIERIKAVAGTAGVDLWINARTDVYLRGLTAAPAAAGETVERWRRHRDAGADSLFVPGLSEEQEIAPVVGDVAMPLNVLAWPGLPARDVLERLGVRRLSAGTGIALAAHNRTYDAARAFLGHEPGDSAMSTADLNALMRA
jgi:2-methylisocitrate lyase-like PEP mutase family enzyme